ncbi:protein D2 [Tetranychus urticae]|uniref:Phosphatidylethanolamine-binding protein n=1 Tax=Tetranychus urticae TaxID=32264 RepID=T1KXS8_TETUR|nr:protein D2 [Tetranychus urticae]
MFKFVTQLLVFLITVSVTVNVQLCGNQNQQTVDEAFIESEIVKDLEIKLPSDGLDLIEVTYPNAICRESVSCGNELKSFQTLEEPIIKYPSESNTLYTFMMLDPDALSPAAPTLRSYIHWMVINVERDDLKSGSTIHSYIAPTPTPLLGAHRYVFMVFEQPEKFAVGSDAIVLERNNFNVAEWAERNRVFGPIAGNYFLEKLP